MAAAVLTLTLLIGSSHPTHFAPILILECPMLVESLVDYSMFEMELDQGLKE